MSIGHLMPESPDLVNGSEDGRARQLVGRFETCADHWAISAYTLAAAMGLPRRQLAHSTAAWPFVAVAIVLIELGMRVQKRLREISPLATRILWV